MEFIHVEGSQTERPLSFDATTSKTVVYVRKNIERVTKTDEQGNSYQVWEYDEAKLPMSDYNAISSALISAVTPYTETKTAYIDDTFVTFENVPSGNVSIYMTDNDGQNVPYTSERINGNIKVSFEKRTSLATVTISIL